MSQSRYAGNVPENRKLDSREAALFRQLLAQYESKSYDRALKAADEILQVKPDHGETLAMKGLVLAYQDLPAAPKEPDAVKREQQLAAQRAARAAAGEELIRMGLERDSESQVIWHVYALFHRAEKHFAEAYSCFKRAAALEVDSVNLMTEVGNLALFLHRYDEHLTARRALLRTAPRLYRNWLGYAVALDVAGAGADAAAVLAAYEDMIRNVPARDYEYSETLLYHARLLAAAKDTASAEKGIALLDANTTRILDVPASLRLRAEFLGRLSRSADAQKTWSMLLDRNSEDDDNIDGYLHAALSTSGSGSAVDVLEGLYATYPRSHAVRRWLLERLSADEPRFAEVAGAYVKSALAKGVPSLFSGLKEVYGDVEKVRIIEGVIDVDAFNAEVDAVEANGTKDAATARTLEATNDSSPATHIWTLYFLAQHYSFLGDQARALKLLNAAIAHTPTLPELYMLRGRVLKRAGNLTGAARSMGQACALDGQDRFLNSKYVKYLIRNGEFTQAEETAGVFTKKDSETPAADLVEMECLWFMVEEARAFAARNDTAAAKSRLAEIQKTFSTMLEDHLDFHGYCLRKSTLRTYLDTIKWSGTLRSHPRYVEATELAVALYTAEFDASDAGDASTVLAPAASFTTHLLTAGPDLAIAWLLDFEIRIREGKLLHALRDVSEAAQLKSHEGRTHLATIALALKVGTDSTAADPSARALRRGLALLLSSDDFSLENLSRINDTFIQTFPGPEGILYGARASVLLGGSATLLHQILEVPGVSYSQAAEAYTLLQKLGTPADVAEFAAAAHTKFPFAEIFGAQPVDVAGAGPAHTEKL